MNKIFVHEHLNRGHWTKIIVHEHSILFIPVIFVYNEQNSWTCSWTKILFMNLFMNIKTLKMKFCAYFCSLFMNMVYEHLWFSLQWTMNNEQHIFVHEQFCEQIIKNVHEQCSWTMNNSVNKSSKMFMNNVHEQWTILCANNLFCSTS